MAGSDLQRIRRLGRYLGPDRRRLLLTLTLLVPLALAGAVQPLLVGQAISVLRTVAGAKNESILPALQALDSTVAIRLIIITLLLSVLLRLALQGYQSFNIFNVGQRLTEELHIFSEVAGALTLVTQRLLGRAKFHFCSIAAPLGCFTSAFRLHQLVAQLRGNGSRVFGNRARRCGRLLWHPPRRTSVFCAHSFEAKFVG